MIANHVTPPAGAGPTCAVFAPLLPLLSLGRLDAEEEAAVRAHAAACTSCGPALADYDALRDALRRGDLEESPHATFRAPTEKIMATREPSASPTPIYSSERVSRRGALLSPLAAVLVVALLASVLFATRGFTSTVLSGPTATTSTATQTSGQSQTGELAQTSWTLTRLIVDGQDLLLVPKRAPTLRFGPHAGQLAGEGGCNGYGGTYTLAGDTLHLSGLYYTQMACMFGGVSLTSQESAYFQALLRVERYHLDGKALTLTSGDGSVQLTFRAS